MRFDIRSMHLVLDGGILDLIRARFEHNLDHFAHRILGGHIRISDTNGPKGGADKSCLVQLRLRGAPDVIIKEHGVDLFRVIDRAAERLVVSVGRAVGRKRRGRGQEQRRGLA